ncbi:MAG TPA: hypothetical protein VNG69_04695 [Casimicrobiaceae bacterium]|nr:hypothetical protein [Casimicrobiaceae bacterium]
MRLAILLLSCCTLWIGGCSTIASHVLHDSRDRFNETAQLTNAEQLLRNLVRLRYAESPYFLEISSVSTSATMAGSLGIFGNTAAAVPGLSANTLINPTLAYSQTPSFVFQPLTGEKFGRQLLRPVELRTLALLRTAGWDLRDILLVLVDSINGVANAPSATQFAPLAIPDNAEFRRVVDLIDGLEDRGLVQLGLEATSAPDPRGDIVLSLQIDKSAASRDDVQELTRRLALDPKNLTYRLAAAATGGGGQTIVVKPRSVLAAMRYLSKGIVVPEDDARSGRVPLPRGNNGPPIDWPTLLEGVFSVRSSDAIPASAYIRVRHDGHWFYIERTDLATKQVFALLETAFALQGGDVPPISTVLTLPIAR